MLGGRLKHSERSNIPSSRKEGKAKGGTGRCRYCNGTKVEKHFEEVRLDEMEQSDGRKTQRQ